MNLLTTASGKTSGGKVPYDRDEVYFANIFHNLNQALRVGLEFAHVETSYADGVISHDNRYQLSAWYIF